MNNGLKDVADVRFFNKETGEEIFFQSSTSISIGNVPEVIEPNMSDRELTLITPDRESTIRMSDEELKDLLNHGFINHGGISGTLTFNYINNIFLANLYGLSKHPEIKRLASIHNQTKNKRIKKKLNKRIGKTINKILFG